MNLDIHPVDQDRWSDLERLFESRGGPHYCWCMAWRRNEFRKSRPGKAGKKAALRARADEGVPLGLLGYVDAVPVAWCSVAPRDTYRPLGGDDSINSVWAVVCFFVKREFRNRGFTTTLVDAACEYARRNGADYLEAYPVDPDSPSYRFMGVRPGFEEKGFELTGRAGTRRYVMRRRL